jgi:hypothetical protein
MLLSSGTPSPTFSGRPSSKVADTNELLHERGRAGEPFVFRPPSVDPSDEVEEDESTLVRLPYGESECRLVD